MSWVDAEHGPFSCNTIYHLTPRKIVIIDETEKHKNRTNYIITHSKPKCVGPFSSSGEKEPKCNPTESHQTDNLHSYYKLLSK